MSKLILLITTITIVASIGVPRIVANEAANDTRHIMELKTWRLWLDEEAQWKNDKLHLPPVEIASLPVNMPTQVGYNGSAGLYWSRFGGARMDELLKRVKDDGTKLVVIADTYSFADALDNDIVKCRGKLEMRSFWHAGGMFVKAHPLFKGLPTNRELNWEYQNLMLYGSAKRYGLYLDGDAIETVMLGNDGHVFEPADVVSVITHGNGKIILSILDMYKFLNDDSPAADTVKKIFTNYLEY